MYQSRNSNAVQTKAGWRFTLPAGETHLYRYAQVDDYTPLARNRFLWKQPCTLSLACRVSERCLPGTWGFGFWNDPFSVALGLGGMGRRLPTLPNCAWFFYASPENYLSFQPKKNGGAPPGNGFLAQVFSAPRIPAPLLMPALFGLPLLLARPVSKWLRANVAARFIQEQAQRLEVDVTQWHAYRLSWGQNHVEFAIDDKPIFLTNISPQGPLGLVIWIDNQYAAWRLDGTLGAGALPNPAAWMEITGVSVERGAI